MLLPLYFVSSGFTSKLSTWLTPPHMNSQMTLLALGVKCGLRVAPLVASLARPSRWSMAPSARPVRPMPVSARKLRRVKPWQAGERIVASPGRKAKEIISRGGGGRQGLFRRGGVAEDLGHHGPAGSSQLVPNQGPASTSPDN